MRTFLTTLRSSAAVLALLIAAPAFAEGEAAPAAPADYVAAKVNGQGIKKSEIDQLLAIAFPGEEKPDFSALDPALQENVVQNIALERILLDQVKKENYQADAMLQKRLEFMKRQLTVKSFLEHKAKQGVTETALRDEYARRIKGQEGKEEIHARHILVSTEAEAKQILETLKKGESFEKLAKEKSKAKNDNGGDLGWFTKDSMFPQLADAAFALKKGETSQPVKTDFGWHVVKVEDRRKAQPQTFEQMKGQLEMEMRDKSEQAYVQSLMKTAKVEVLGPDGQPVKAGVPAAGPATGGMSMKPAAPAKAQ